MNAISDARQNAIDGLGATGSAVKGIAGSQPDGCFVLDEVFIIVVAVGDPIAWNEDDDLMPNHGAGSKCNANEPLGYRQTTGSKSNTAKFDQDNLSNDCDDHDVPKNWISKNVLENIALIFELAHVDFVEFRHHDEHIKDHCVVYGRQFFVLAVASLVEKSTRMAI